jgi:4-amino-4-deoxy-L-arabinose transferase-like glycosyltransferase
MSQRKSYSNYLPLLFILLIHLAGYLILRPVYPHSDDYCYAADAHNFLHHSFHLTYNKFQNRFGVYLPTALFFLLFGITPYTISLWSLIASCLTIIFVFLLVNKISGTSIAIVASLLIAINVLQITYSIALFPDLIVSCYAILAILILYKGREEKINLLYAIALPIVLLIAMFTKETIFLLLPFLVIILILDLIKKEHIVFWKKTFPFFVISTIFFFLFFWKITGDAFHRIKSMIDFKDNYLMPAEDAIKLRSTFPTNIFLWMNEELGYVFLILFSIPSFVSLIKFKNNFHFYISLYSLILLIEFIILFHTEKYGAVFLQDRIWMLLIAPLSIVSAPTLIESNKRTLITLFYLFLLFGILNIPLVKFNREVLYLSFPLIIGGLIFFNKNNKPKPSYFLLLPLIILFINFIYGNSNYRVARLSSSNEIKEQLDLLNNSNGRKIILSRDGLSDDYKIYNGFNEYQNLSFVTYDNADSVVDFKNVYCIINTEESVIPVFINQHPEAWKSIYEKHNLFIYKKN